MSRGGATTDVRFEAIDGWIKSVSGAPAGTLLDERLANAVVHVDGNLAKQDGAWKIFSVVDTRRREACPPAPSR